MASLPKSFNLAEVIPSLPDGATSQLVSCRPISGSAFTANQIIEVDLGSRGFCDPKSLAIRYKMTVNTDVSGAALVGVPVYTPFARLSTLVGGASIDAVSQWNQCAYVLVNGEYDVAQKYGVQTNYGFSNPDPLAGGGNMQYLDGRGCEAVLADASANAVFTMSAPLIGTLLSNCEKQLPLFCMPQIRFQFTLDSLANMSFAKIGAVGTGYAAFTKVSISNFELVYQMADLGSSVEAMILGMGRTLSLKTSGISNSAVSVPAASSGSQSYVFNQRFASVRGAYICPNRADGNGNKWAEITDLTSGNGDYQILIGNEAKPQTVLSTALNRSGILNETRRTFGSLYDAKNAMSINTAEFGRTINDASNVLLYYEPSKFIVGINLNKIQSDDSKVLMCGASTYQSPISVVVNINTATTVAATLNLILDYDAILVLDPLAKQLSVRS